jgi:simple sugar transport system permease protein
LLSADFWDSMVRVTGPIAFGALACTLASRAGVLFIGVEGAMLVSVFFSIAGVVWAGSIWLGVLLGAAAGMTVGLAFGVFSIVLRMGDVVAGLIVYVGTLGLTAFLTDQLFPNGASIGARSLGPFWGSFGGDAGSVLFHQQPLIYVAIVAAVAMHLFLRSRRGLVVRSSGESVNVARSFGIRLVRVRFFVLAASGILAGLGGATLGLAIVGTFESSVVGGRGFIGLACVILGAWRPLAVLLASSVFGLAYAVQFRVNDIGQWIQLFPYVMTLLAIALVWGRAQGPAEEGRDLPDEAA